MPEQFGKWCLKQLLILHELNFLFFLWLNSYTIHNHKIWPVLNSFCGPQSYGTNTKANRILLPDALNSIETCVLVARLAPPDAKSFQFCRKMKCLASPAIEYLPSHFRRWIGDENTNEDKKWISLDEHENVRYVLILSAYGAQHSSLFHLARR
jgi:hypothetical protein